MSFCNVVVKIVRYKLQQRQFDNFSLNFPTLKSIKIGSWVDPCVRRKMITLYVTSAAHGHTHLFRPHFGTFIFELRRVSLVKWREVRVVTVNRKRHREVWAAPRGGWNSCELKKIKKKSKMKLGRRNGEENTLYSSPSQTTGVTFMYCTSGWQDQGLMKNRGLVTAARVNTHQSISCLFIN
jgi:hypothetical protein